MAIRVTLEAFISTQKLGVQKQMSRTFAKYMSYKKDNNELLLYLLKNLAMETAVYMRNRCVVLVLFYVWFCWCHSNNHFYCGKKY